MAAELSCWAEIPFFDLVEPGHLRPPASLESVSKLKSSRHGHETDMIRRFEQAWRTPLCDLTCEQVRLLLGQQAGLEWLAEPVLQFVARYPVATVTNYPGEMAYLAVRAAAEMDRFARPQFRSWLAGDLRRIEEALAFDPCLGTEFAAMLEAARQGRLKPVLRSPD